MSADHLNPGDADVPTAVDAMNEGATEFLTKPIDAACGRGPPCGPRASRAQTLRGDPLSVRRLHSMWAGKPQRHRRPCVRCARARANTGCNAVSSRAMPAQCHRTCPSPSIAMT